MARAGTLLPYVGITVFVLLPLTWLTSAGGYLGKDCAGPGGD